MTCGPVLDVEEQRLRDAVAEVCEAQRRAGIDFINEGELTKGGHWIEYLAARLGGYEPAGHPGALGELLLSSTDWVEFRDFYLAVLQNGTLFEQSGAAQHVPEGAEEHDPGRGGLGGDVADALPGSGRPRSRDRGDEGRPRRHTAVRRLPDHDRAAQRRARS